MELDFYSNYFSFINLNNCFVLNYNQISNGLKNFINYKFIKVTVEYKGFVKFIINRKNEVVNLSLIKILQ